MSNEDLDNLGLQNGDETKKFREFSLDGTSTGLHNEARGPGQCEHVLGLPHKMAELAKASHQVSHRA